MKSSKLFLYCFCFVFAFFLQSCKSDSKDTATNNSAKQSISSQKRAKPTTNPKVDAQVKKVIDEVNAKIEQTEKEVDKLLEGI